MLEPHWKQHFRWSLPHNPWSTSPQRSWIWHFLDQQGNAWGSWFVESTNGGQRQIAVPDLPPAYSTGIAIATDAALIGSATQHSFTVHRVEPGKPSQLFIQQQERIDIGTLSHDEKLVCLIAAQQDDWLHPMLYVYDMQGKQIASLSDGPGYGIRCGNWSPYLTDYRLLVFIASTYTPIRSAK